MNARQLYKTLTPEQQKILHDKRVSLTRTPKELLALLKPVADFDRLSDSNRSKVGCALAVAVVAAIASLFVMFANEFAWWAVLLFLTAVAAAIVTGRIYGWSSKMDLSNNLRGFAFPLLALLREDMRAEDQITLKLDMSNPTAEQKRKSAGKAYKAGVYYKVIDNMYEDPWMDGEARLADGCRLRWSVVDLIRERTKTKKNPRGKHKTKVKYAKKSIIEVEVALPTKRYELANVNQAGAKVSAIEHGEKRSTVVLKKAVKRADLEPCSPRELLDLIARVYQQASKVRVGARS